MYEEKLKVFEYNFDGLAAPTHNYSGLAIGNLASLFNRYSISSPKKAALEGLNKMKLLFHLGVKQGLIPPQERPYLRALREILGYSGTDKKILERITRHNLEHLLMVSSSSSMWVANAATVSPSSDTADHKIHLTPANLISQKHRSIETQKTAEFFKMIFPDPDVFIHHSALKDDPRLSDEGSANHMRLCAEHGQKGIEIFVYGKNGTKDQPKKFKARQSLKASLHIVKNHRLHGKEVVLAQQNPQVIDRGIFHNDVIAVSNENVLVYHTQAYVNCRDVIQEIQKKFTKVSSNDLYLIEITDEQLSIKEAVNSYFFNSQIVTLPNGAMVWIAPKECQKRKIQKILEVLIQKDNPLKEVCYVDLNQSMLNGGGPACLRWRVVLNEREEKGIHPGCVLDQEKFSKLEDWIHRHYRDQLRIEELRDYRLLQESYQALDELTQILGLGSIYDFQK